MALTTKQQVFVVAYVAHRNGTLAAIDAGYSERSAAEAGSALLSKPNVRREIDRRLKRLTDKYEISADRIMRELAKIAFVNLDDFVRRAPDGTLFYDFSTASKDQMAGLTSIDITERAHRGETERRVKVRLGEKRSALMDLAKVMRMLPADRVEHTGADGGPIEVANSLRIDVRALEPEQRAQLQAILLSTKKKPEAEITDLEDTSGGDAAPAEENK
jgi:phage terminase small subunit